MLSNLTNRKAIKCISSLITKEDVDSLKKLDSSYIAKFYDSFEESSNGLTYMVYEYYPVMWQ